MFIFTSWMEEDAPDFFFTLFLILILPDLRIKNNIELKLAKHKITIINIHITILELNFWVF